MKIIHCADIHLDSSLHTYLDDHQANIRNNEILHSFERLTIYAKENKVDIVLIAGDLFDQEYVSKKTLDLVFSFIEASAPVNYFYVPGNHDLKTIHLFENKPSNLYVFSKEWETLTFENITITSRMHSTHVEENMPTLPNDKFNIVMLHGDITNSQDNHYIDINEFKNKNIHYLALGHIHSYQKYKLDQSGILAYSGCLEGRGFDECGAKGFILLDLEQKNISFIPFACRTIYKIEVDISHLQNNYEIIQKIREEVENIQKENIVEIILKGTKDLDTFISLRYIKQVLQNDFFYIKVKDETKLYISKEEYQNDISLKGEFIRLVLDSSEVSHDMEQIIQYGIEALSGEIE